MFGVIYLATYPSEGRFKVGYSGRMVERSKWISKNIGTPTDTRLFNVGPRAHLIEKWLHRIFRRAEPTHCVSKSFGYTEFYSYNLLQDVRVILEMLEVVAGTVCPYDYMDEVFNKSWQGAVGRPLSSLDNFRRLKMAILGEFIE